MTIEVSYADGRKFVANVTENALENVKACLLDDDSVIVTCDTNGKENAR